MASIVVSISSSFVQFLHQDDKVQVCPLVGVVSGLMEGGDEDALAAVARLAVAGRGGRRGRSCGRTRRGGGVSAALALQGLHGGGDHAAELPIGAASLGIKQADLLIQGIMPFNTIFLKQCLI